MTKRILVVEDQEDLRGVLRTLLTGSGYEMIEAADGQAGVAKAKSERPDLILMDIQLPILDGYETTRQIKADPNLKATPIIAVSSYAMKGGGEGACVGLRPLRDQALQPCPTFADYPRVSWRTGVGELSPVCGSAFGVSTSGKRLLPWVIRVEVLESVMKVKRTWPRQRATLCAKMYGPAARRKTDSQDDEREMLHQCIRPQVWSSCSGPAWISARIQD
jgi:two-component system, cell cycle response regulator DivK